MMNDNTSMKIIDTKCEHIIILLERFNNIK